MKQIFLISTAVLGLTVAHGQTNDTTKSKLKAGMAISAFFPTYVLSGGIGFSPCIQINFKRHFLQMGTIISKKVRPYMPPMGKWSVDDFSSTNLTGVNANYHMTVTKSKSRFNFILGVSFDYLRLKAKGTWNYNNEGEKVYPSYEQYSFSFSGGYSYKLTPKIFLFHELGIKRGDYKIFYALYNTIISINGQPAPNPYIMKENGRAYMPFMGLSLCYQICRQ